jgi:hypothetical protein
MEPRTSILHSQVPTLCRCPEPEQFQKLCPSSRLFDVIRNITSFYGKEMLASSPTPKLEDHHMSAVCECLFNIFAATLHI